jgi:hypothetical protein
MKPIVISTGAKLVSLKATSYAVIVVPMLLPKMIPTLLLNERTPALTKPIEITDVVELD